MRSAAHILLTEKYNAVRLIEVNRAAISTLFCFFLNIHI